MIVIAGKAITFQIDIVSGIKKRHRRLWEGEYMDIEFSRSAAKFLQAADRPTRERIKTGILGLIQQSPIGDIKMLQGWKPLSYRLRIGKYRVVYSYLQRKSGGAYLYIRDIGARGGIYK